MVFFFFYEFTTLTVEVLCGVIEFFYGFNTVTVEVLCSILCVFL